MKKITLFISIMTLSLVINAQSITLKFTAKLNASHVNTDSIRISNHAHPGDTVLYWPDTTLVLVYSGTGIADLKDQPGFGIRLIAANPGSGLVDFQVSMPSYGQLVLRVSDVMGRTTGELKRNIPAGTHLFRYSPSAPGLNIVSASFGSQIRSLKLISPAGINGGNTLDYLGAERPRTPGKSASLILSFTYHLGDSLYFTAWYRHCSSNLKTATQTNSTFTFNFPMNVPCPGDTSFTYGGQVYHTVLVGNQCWMKENLNIGTMVNSTTSSFSHSNCNNNGIIEKYCYNNDTANCLVFGGLYDWNEMMQYDTTPGIQGICPTGWHIPTDAEWCTLTTFLDTTINCSNFGYSGTNAGGKLKETGATHWNSGNLGATNESGFTAFGAGYRDVYGNFYSINNIANYWSSSAYDNASGLSRYLIYLNTRVSRDGEFKPDGFSVRCIKN